MGTIKHSPHLKFTQLQKCKFVEAIEKTGRIFEACKCVGISQGTYYKHRINDMTFAANVEEAMNVFRDSIVKAVHSRAIEGWEEPVFYNGEIVGYTRKYSDKLLVALAQRFIPEFAPRSHIHQTTTVSGTIGLKNLTREDRDELRTILERRSVTIDLTAPPEN